MTRVFPWRPESAREACRQAVLALTRGGVVGLPTEASYVLAASAAHPQAIERLRGAGYRPVIALSGPLAAAAWLPEWGPLAQRLAQRCWPGPVLLVGEADGEAEQLRQLPGEVSKPLCRDGCLGLWVPSHEAVRQVRDALPHPLVCADTGLPTAEDLAHSAGPAASVIIDGGPSLYPGAATAVSVNSRAWTVLREGVVPVDDIARLSARTIVFVCTGNTCRSPLAEALCKQLLAERLGCTLAELPKRGFVVLSAGLAAMMGGAAATEAVEVAREYGADLSAHASQPLTPDLAAQADDLIAMTRSHRAALLALGGQRVRLMSAAGEDVADPIGGDREVYRDCARQIRRHLEELLAEWFAS